MFRPAEDPRGVQVLTVAYDQTTGGVATVYLNDSNNPTGYTQVLETRTGGALATTYALGKAILAQNANGTISYIMPDAHGSTRQLTAYTSDATTNGKVCARYDYDAYGAPISFTASTHPANTASALVQYAGMLLDPITGNYRTETREYSALDGRFLWQDQYLPAAGDSSNANLYVYAAGNPTNAADPSGRTFVGLLGSALIAASRYAQDLGRGMMVAGLAGMVWEALVYTNVSAVLAYGNNSPTEEARLRALQAQALVGMKFSAAVAIAGVGMYILGSALTVAGTAIVAMSNAGNSGNFSTAENEAMFWSTDTSGAVDMEKKAGEIASSQGRTTLEQFVKARGLSLPPFDRANPASMQAWQKASFEFAKNAKGVVKVALTDNVNPLSVWASTELPALEANPYVTQIIKVDPNTLKETVLPR